MLSTPAPNLQITVNGAPHLCTHLATIRDLIAELALDPRKIAIERNGAIIPRSAYDTTAIMDGDAVEIVGFIGGG